MNASDYQRAAERTMVGHDNEMRMMNAALGLCGEAAEIDQVVASDWGEDNNDLINEAGDLLWYVAQMCRALGKSIASVPPNRQVFIGWTEQQAVTVLYRNTGALADMVKKRVFHRGPTLNPFKIMEALEATVGAVDHILRLRGMTLEEAFDANNAKLLKRHPNGFSPETANARADEVRP